MYFAVVKLSFEDVSSSSADVRRDLHGLVEKLRSRFKVCAAAIEEGDATAIAVTALGSSEARLTQTLDAITDFCETSGFGRLDSEQTLMDHIDAVCEMESEGEDE
jgi:uncharacterized protein YlxP (DUF503 family)